jgi:glutaredoxin
MKLSVYTGPSCPNCPPAKDVCKGVAEELGLEFSELDIGENMIEALQLQIASTPSIVLGEDVIFRSVVPTKEQLMEEIKKRT